MSETFTVDGTEAAGYVLDLVPEALTALSVGELGSREAVETELDAMLGSVRAFWRMEPDEVMRACAAYSARATELEVHLHRVEGKYREFKQIRTMQVQKLLAELDRQFRVASRLLEMRRQDLEQAKGF